MNRTTVLDKAKSAVAERPTQYGTPENNFERIARLWNAHLENTYDPESIDLMDLPDFDATDVAIMLGLVKIARVEHDPKHLDSWVDLAGYAACGAEVSGAGDTVIEQTTTREHVAGGVTPIEHADYGLRPHGVYVGARHNFEIGDLVQFEDAPLSAKPGVVISFNGDRLLVLFPGAFVPMSCLPSSLRHVPKPESKFGFTVGETVNANLSPIGENPGRVLGFGENGILVTWLDGTGGEFCWKPTSLRHGP